MNPLFIDGQTRTALVTSPEPGLFPDFKISYRPALAVERHLYAKAAMGGKPEEIDSAEVDIITRHLVDWCLPTGESFGPVAADRVRVMAPSARAKVLDLVMGYKGHLEDQKN